MSPQGAGAGPLRAGSHGNAILRPVRSARSRWAYRCRRDGSPLPSVHPTEGKGDAMAGLLAHGSSPTALVFPGGAPSDRTGAQAAALRSQLRGQRRIWLHKAPAPASLFRPFQATIPIRRTCGAAFGQGAAMRCLRWIGPCETCYGPGRDRRGKGARWTVPAEAWAADRASIRPMAATRPWPRAGRMRRDHCWICPLGSAPLPILFRPCRHRSGRTCPNLVPKRI